MVPTEPISRKNASAVDVARDFSASNAVTRQYAILSSPRTGSTLLSRMLFETGHAGDPLEYYNPRLLNAERQRIGNAKLGLNEFLASMSRRRTSENGVFGIKMHYRQLLDAAGLRSPDAGVVQYLRSFDRLIFVRRRMHLRQAVSRAIAERSNIWSSEDGRPQTLCRSDLQPAEVVFSLATVVADDLGWEKLLGVNRIAALEVWYEDLVADYDGVSRRVLEHLEIGDEVASIPPPPIERQHSALNDEVLADVLAYLGLSIAS